MTVVRQPERRGLEPERQVVVAGDEAAHQQERQQAQPDDAAVAEQVAHGADVLARAGRAGSTYAGAAGSSRVNASAATSATTPSSATAARHELLSSTRPGISRPEMPPRVLPATYTPIAVPSSAGCTSSPRCATATATTAASETPTSPRATQQHPEVRRGRGRRT